MNFQELLGEVQKLRIEEKRSASDDYLEVVIARTALASLHQSLTAYFGKPLKAEGHHACGEATRWAKAYGGVREDQTLYCLREEAYESLALLWPWGGGERVTVKILRKPRKLQAAGGLGSFLGKLFGGQK